jgi:lysophospholipase L1-like esterase
VATLVAASVGTSTGVGAAVTSSGAVSGPLGSGWVATWAASPTRSGPGLVGVTQRMVIRAAIGGSGVRVKLSNALGGAPVTIDDVDMGVSGGGATVIARTSQHATFSGSSSVTIPAGVEVWSDPVSLRVTAQQDVALSLFARAAPQLTILDDSTDVPSFQAPGGDHASDPSGTTFTDSGSGWLLADGLAVAAPRGTEAVVAFGDSITAGLQLHPMPNVSWPSLLAVRLRDRGQACPSSVVNEGITGNQLIRGAPQRGLGGPSGLDRAARDVFSQPGARVVVLLLGINDLGLGNATAGEVIAADRTMIAQAHSHGFRIVAGTLTPSGDPSNPGPYASYSSPTMVTARQAVNRWIRSSRAFDGVIDFAAAVAKSSAPNVLAPAFDSGDQLHLNSAGDRRMANVIRTSSLGCPTS